MISNITPIYANTGNDNEVVPYEGYTEQKIAFIPKSEALDSELCSHLVQIFHFHQMDQVL